MAEKRLATEIAEQFVADDESVDLSEFTEVDDGAVENLSRHRGYLDLNGLTSLSDAAAESLSKREKGYLELDSNNFLSSAGKILYHHLSFPDDDEDWDDDDD